MPGPAGQARQPADTAEGGRTTNLIRRVYSSDMNLGITEMIFLFVLGLLLFGPKKLPEIGRQLGKALAEFKRASNEFQSQLNDEVRKLEIEETIAATTTPAEPPAGTASRGSFEATMEQEPAAAAETPPEGLTHPEHQNG